MYADKKKNMKNPAEAGFENFKLFDHKHVYAVVLERCL